MQGWKKPTSKNTKKNLKQNKRIPRISTRGFYDLSSGKTLKKKQYDLYPKKFFEELGRYPEFTIMVHGMRNNKSGALAKFAIAQRRLRHLGYKHPVIGFSYDSNVRGVQYKSCELKAMHVGEVIARKNGCNLAKFIMDSKKQNPDTKIRLMGHSLGTEVIVYALDGLDKGAVESAYFFGSSVPGALLVTKKFHHTIQKTVRQKIYNYYSVHDGVLKYASDHGLVKNPVGYVGIRQKTMPKLVEKHVRPKTHRFIHYSQTLHSYP